METDRVATTQVGQEQRRSIAGSRRRSAISITSQNQLPAPKLAENMVDVAGIGPATSCVTVLRPERYTTTQSERERHGKAMFMRAWGMFRSLPPSLSDTE